MTCHSKKAESTIANQKTTALTVEFTEDSCANNAPLQKATQQPVAP
jgi:hypothetical protein